MTQPTPTPAASGSDSFGGISLTGGDTTTSSHADLYGLGAWGSQPVNPGGLPFLGRLLASGHRLTADDIMKAFAASDPESKATVQHALLMGGFYPDTYSPDFGVIGPKDIAAFSDAIISAGTAGASVSDLLTKRAQYGAAAGVAAAQVQPAAPATATVNLPNTQDLEAEALKMFQQELGHKATPEQAAAFAGLYRAMAAGVQRANNQAAYDAAHPALPAALVGADPGQLVQDATSVTTHGTQLAPRPPGHDPDLRPTQQTTVTQPGDFSQQIGGLMTLGQAVAAAQQPGSAGGLTQLTEDSPPSPTVAAENYARNTDPKGAAANDVANVFDMFLGILQKNFAG